MMNGEEILSHFAARLRDVEAALPSVFPVSRQSTAPSTAEELDAHRRSYEGNPVVFPASWITSWETALGSPSLFVGLQNLLGNVLQVEAFRLHYNIVVEDQSECLSPEVKEAREMEAEISQDKCKQKWPLTGESASTEREDGRIEEFFRSLPRFHLHPIPTSTAEWLDFGAFVSEASSLLSAPKNQLLYLTWRSLPSFELESRHLCTPSSLPMEFQYFIEKLVLPSTTPGFVLKDSIKQRNLWMGSLVTSRLHFDALDNIHVCLSGRKVFHLYSPLDLPNLYPEPWREDKLNNFSTIATILLANQACHPRFFQYANCFRAEVKDGEAIFIPAGWWHEVFTLQETISANLWFGPSPNASFRPTLLHLKSDKYLQFMLRHQ